MKVIILLIFLVSLTANDSPAQDWMKLITLESNRVEVEGILGKPTKFFDTYGTYRTQEGRFHIWYSKGGCHKNFAGLQYNVPAQKLTRLLVYPGNGLPLESYISNKEGFEKRKSPDPRLNRNYYISPDEKIIYGTIIRADSTEFVYTIELQPSKDKQYLLCKTDKKSPNPVISNGL